MRRLPAPKAFGAGTASTLARIVDWRSSPFQQIGGQEWPPYKFTERELLRAVGERSVRGRPTLNKCELQDFPAYGNADDKKDQAHHEEEKEQEFCNSRGGRRDAGKSE